MLADCKVSLILLGLVGHCAHGSASPPVPDSLYKLVVAIRSFAAATFDVCQGFLLPVTRIASRPLSTRQLHQVIPQLSSQGHIAHLPVLATEAAAALSLIGVLCQEPVGDRCAAHRFST